MTPRIREEYARIIERRGIRPTRVLEIGAMPEYDTLLTLPCFAGTFRLGVNPAVGGVVVYEGATIEPATVGELGLTGTFDVVVCNSVLEHDPEWWTTVEDAKHVLRHGGWLLIGTPSFGDASEITRDNGELATVTMAIHECPRDYYRFSRSAYEDVIMAGLEQVELAEVMDPPRIIASGRKPC